MRKVTDSEGLQNAASSLAVGGNSLEQSIALLTSSFTTTQDWQNSPPIWRHIGKQLAQNRENPEVGNPVGNV